MQLVTLQGSANAQQELVGRVLRLREVLIEKARLYAGLHGEGGLP